MNESKALQAVIDMVPNWYQANCGWIKNTISIGETHEIFYTERWLTPVLRNFLSIAQVKLPDLLTTSGNISDAMAIEIIQESLAKSWLELHSKNIDWGKVFSYNRVLENRTYENNPISINLLIREGEGSFDVTDESFYKLVDPLGSNVNVYFEVNQDLCYRDYNSIPWSQVQESTSYKFLPEFLHPFQQIKQCGDWSVHKTSRGDLVILDCDGLRATRRKGRWTIYDPPTIKNMIVDLIGSDSYWVACNLFELMLDLSYKRHGALLVYDDSGDIDSYVTNKESLVSSSNPCIDEVRLCMSAAIKNISLASANSKDLKKRLLMELASMDGAIIYNGNNLKGFGSMIQSHPDAGEAAGARTTAALSAYLYGCFPVKISADGDITIFFTSRNSEGEKSPAKLSFM